MIRLLATMNLIHASLSTNLDMSLYQVTFLEEDIWSRFIFGEASQPTTEIGCAAYCGANNCDLFHYVRGDDNTAAKCLIGNTAIISSSTLITNPQATPKKVYLLSGTANPCRPCIFPIVNGGSYEHECIADPGGSGRDICYTETTGPKKYPVLGSEHFCPSSGCDLTPSYTRTCEECVFPWSLDAGTYSSCTNPDGDVIGDWCATLVDSSGFYIGGYYAYCPPGGCDQYLP